MTIPVAVPNRYVGNGSTADYDYEFKIVAIDGSDIVAVVAHPTTGVETVLTLTDDYTVDGVGDKDGGQISLVDDGQDWIDSNGFLATGWVLVLRRVRPLTQTTDIRNQGDYFPETHEDEFDNGRMIAQQQQEEIGRCVKVPVTSDIDPDDLVEELVGAAADAEAAVADAETAQGLAEDARDAAVVAQGAAEGFADDAEAALAGLAAQTAELAIVGGSVAVDASRIQNGGVFTLLVDDDFTLANPTNLTDGKKMIFRFKQDEVGGHEITLGDKYTVASEINAVVLSTAADAIDHMGAAHNEDDDTVEVIAFSSEQA